VSRHRLEIRITPRPGLLDPQGNAVAHALASLGYEGVDEVRVGRLVGLELDAPSPEAAVARAEEMCRKLLANPVTEDYRIRVANEGDR
jgi:phosphoribosylformylglycinamidine synthase subunit PurS